MSEIGRELQLTLQAAFREAMVRRHAYVTVEHLRYALLHDKRGAEILRHAGADVPALKAALDRFFDDDLETVPGDDDFETDTRDILALTKVNFNGCYFADGLPVTLKFADAIGEILTAAPNLDGAPLPFKYYI